MEVMGLMMGEFVDDYTVQVIDVFAMPQSGTTVTVESVDHVFQAKMAEMLKQTGRHALRSLNFVRMNSLTPPFHSGPKPWSAGITHILVSAVGYPVST